MNRFPSHVLILKGTGVLEEVCGRQGDVGEPWALPSCPATGTVRWPKMAQIVQPLLETQSAPPVITPLLHLKRCMVPGPAQPHREELHPHPNLAFSALAFGIMSFYRGRRHAVQLGECRPVVRTVGPHPTSGVI